MLRAAAIFSIAMGVMMLGTWAFLLLTDRFPAIRTVPLQTGYLLTAEFLTGAALVVGGIGVLKAYAWAPPLLLIAMGELIYCTIRYAGELGQGGSTAGLIFFTAVGLAGVIFAFLLIASGGRQWMGL